MVVSSCNFKCLIKIQAVNKNKYDMYDCHFFYKQVKPSRLDGELPKGGLSIGSMG